jgi:hypothetical protein
MATRAGIKVLVIFASHTYRARVIPDRRVTSQEMSFFRLQHVRQLIQNL